MMQAFANREAVKATIMTGKARSVPLSPFLAPVSLISFLTPRRIYLSRVSRGSPSHVSLLSHRDTRRGYPQATFWTRSRQKLWVKGETSECGHQPTLHTQPPTRQPPRCGTPLDACRHVREHPSYPATRTA